MNLRNIFGGGSKSSFDIGLEKTRKGFFSRLANAILGKTTIDAEVMEKIEETLLSSDVGISTTVKIIGSLQKKVEETKSVKTTDIYGMLKTEILQLFANSSDGSIDLPKEKPYVIMVVGVNGVGKTTTIGKLAHHFKKTGLRVMLGAADTFRAAAVDQLQIWAKRADVPIVSRGMGADPPAVAFDTLQSAVAQKMDIVIIDTAGRLHNKVGLMNELSKIRRVMQKVVPTAPHEVLLVLDASTGQNAFEQCKEFTKATDVTALALTKLDGTAKGGVVIGISDQFKIPVRYIGLGEKIEDLRLFDKEQFVESLFKSS
jgi:fused signal recognition particle receptor